MSAITTTAPLAPPAVRGDAAPRAGISWADRTASTAFWALVVGYTAIFCALSLRRYDAFLMHALDMGNMEQAIWNTFHGHPFRFTNMQAHLRIEAYGTDTRLSFHVEPILLPLSLVPLFNLGPPGLLIVQTVVLASGALAVRRLVRRHLFGHPLAEVAFPLAYLLFPALEAANLYEFHPVTLTAALLPWALVCADEGRIRSFVLVAIAATWCKEEIGLVIALLALWGVRRGVLPRRIGVGVAMGAVLWALLAVLVIVPIAQHAQHSAVTSSPYLTRYLDRNLTSPDQYVHVTLGDVLRYWLAHPDRLVSMVTAPPKWGFLHRLLVPSSYLALLSPLTLLISLPSFLLILLSVDQHMYGGLGHYSAEFVGIVMAASVFGLARLARLGGHAGLRPRTVIAAGSLTLIVISAANQHVNGFAPLGASFDWPTLDRHVRLGQQMLALIPPNAAVSAQDTLDPHLSDRAAITLFPDLHGADYVALDASASPIPASPASLRTTVAALLATRRWEVLFADDGYLLLHHSPTASSQAPVLPAAFYTFARIAVPPPTMHRVHALVGGLVEMVGYRIRRQETVNLRPPDVVLTTYWRASRRVTRQLAMTTYLTGVGGRLRDRFMDQSALDWVPMRDWTADQFIAVSSTSMGIGSTWPGHIAACVAVRAANAVPGPMVSPSHDPGRLPIRVLDAARGEVYQVVAGGQALCVSSISVGF